MTTEAPPLDGILIIALEQAVAGPLCSSRLADAGAHVIKIERSGGDFARNYDHVVDGESTYFRRYDLPAGAPLGEHSEAIHKEFAA
jgi:crotonobetainyl-CoA:carnitine CoA-transferase CaiB-like acyl-CoA transferase